jgi:hypothetical protein
MRSARITNRNRKHLLGELPRVPGIPWVCHKPKECLQRTYERCKWITNSRSPRNPISPASSLPDHPARSLPILVGLSPADQIMPPHH